MVFTSRNLPERLVIIVTDDPADTQPTI